jgi:hypothetical protein
MSAFQSASDTLATSPGRRMPALLTHVAPAERLQRRGRRRGDLVRVGDVASDRHGRCAQALDLVGGPRAALGVAIERCDLGANRRERERDPAADAARRAGDDAHLVAQAQPVAHAFLPA